MEDPQIELDYLRWFHDSCDFGPAHEDVISIMLADYVKNGGVIPAAYKQDEDAE